MVATRAWGAPQDGGRGARGVRGLDDDVGCGEDEAFQPNPRGLKPLFELSAKIPEGRACMCRMMERPILAGRSARLGKGGGACR